MQHPQYNMIAKIYSVFDITIIVLSSVVMVLESIKELEALPNFEAVSMGVLFCLIWREGVFLCRLLCQKIALNQGRNGVDRYLEV